MRGKEPHYDSAIEYLDREVDDKDLCENSLDAFSFLTICFRIRLCKMDRPLITPYMDCHSSCLANGSHLSKYEIRIEAFPSQFN